MYKLARAVDISHLSLGNPGGGVWSELKSTPGLAPKWAIVKKAQLWVDEDRYKTTVWPWLTGKGEDILSAEATPVMTQQGEVLSVDVELGDRTDRLLCGQIGPILNTRSQVNLVYVEVKTGEVLQGDVLGAIQVGLKQKTGVRLIYWGSEEAISEQMAGPLGKLLQEGQALYGYKCRKVHIFLPKDDPLGEKEQYNQNVHRVVLLISPPPFRNSMNYVVSHVQWSPTILSHLIKCMDIIRSSHLWGTNLQSMCGDNYSRRIVVNMSNMFFPPQTTCHSL